MDLLTLSKSQEGYSLTREFGGELQYFYLIKINKVNFWRSDLEPKISAGCREHVCVLTEQTWEKYSLRNTPTPFEPTLVCISTSTAQKHAYQKLLRKAREIAEGKTDITIEDKIRSLLSLS